MRKLGGSASRLLVDLEQGVRRVGRDVGLGVADALQARPDTDEPGWRAERFALGFLRGFDAGLEDEHLRQTAADALEGGVQIALSATLAHSEAAEELCEHSARAFARGALAELRRDLGEDGDGPLTRSLCVSSRRVVREAAIAVVTPIVLGAVLCLAGALLLRVTHRRR